MSASAPSALPFRLSGPFTAVHRVLDPLVRAVLRSPLERLASFPRAALAFEQEPHPMPVHIDLRSDHERQVQLQQAITRPPPSSALIELDGVEKVYRMGKVDYRALRGVDLTIGSGEMVAVVGPSGSGKTTILNMITGIDRPSSGTSPSTDGGSTR